MSVVRIRTTAGWVDLQTVGPQGPAGNPIPQLVSVLPSSPSDGQEVYFLADATNGVVWHLRYRSASSSAYKWEFIGGGTLSGEFAASWGVGSPGAPGAEQTASSLTPPLAGDYDVEFGGSISSSAAVTGVQVKARSSAVVGGASAGTISSALITLDLPVASPSYVSRQSKLLAIPANQAVYWNFLRTVATTTTLTTTDRFLRLRPVRVG